VTAVVLAEIVPVLLLAPIAGSLVDRLPRVRVMVAADRAEVVLAGTLALWHDHLVAAYAVAFGLSAGQVFFSPAAQSLLPSVVRDDELVAANSGIWTAAVTIQIAVAPVAALLAVNVGFGPAFAVNAMSFALSAVVLRGLRESERPPPATVNSPFAHARGALGPLKQIPLLKALARRAVPRRAVRRRHQRCSSCSRRNGSAAARATACSSPRSAPALPSARCCSCARPRIDPRRPLFVFGPYAIRGLVDLVLVLVTSGPLATAAALVVYGLSTSTGSVCFSSLVQSRVPEHLRGRAFAGFDVVWQTGRMLSLLGGGLLADTNGIHAVYLVGGLLPPPPWAPAALAASAADEPAPATSGRMLTMQPG